MYEWKPEVKVRKLLMFSLITAVEGRITGEWEEDLSINHDGGRWEIADDLETKE